MSESQSEEEKMNKYNELKELQKNDFVSESIHRNYEGAFFLRNIAKNNVWDMRVDFSQALNSSEFKIFQDLHKELANEHLDQSALMNQSSLMREASFRQFSRPSQSHLMANINIKNSPKLQNKSSFDEIKVGDSVELMQILKRWLSRFTIQIHDISSMNKITYANLDEYIEYNDINSIQDQIQELLTEVNEAFFFIH